MLRPNFKEVVIGITINVPEEVTLLPDKERIKYVRDYLYNLAGSNDGSEFLANANVVGCEEVLPLTVIDPHRYGYKFYFYDGDAWVEGNGLKSEVIKFDYGKDSISKMFDLLESVMHC